MNDDKKVEVCGYILENTYFYIDEESHHGFLIDPGAESQKLLSMILENQWVIEAILITHGHFDHIGAVNDLRKVLQSDVYAYETSALYLENPFYNLSSAFGEEIKVTDVKRLKEHDVVCLKENPDFSLKVMYTPGHTKDSCVYYNEDCAFVGDTIFKGSVGNTGFPLGNEEELWSSIFHKIFALNPSTKLYSGHSEVTTVLEEKERYL